MTGCDTAGRLGVHADANDESVNERDKISTVEQGSWMAGFVN